MLVEECEPQRALCGSGREGGERQSKRKEQLHKEGAVSSVEGFGGQREMRTVRGVVTGEPYGTRGMGGCTWCWGLKKNREERTRGTQKERLNHMAQWQKEHNKYKQPKINVKVLH